MSIPVDMYRMNVHAYALQLYLIANWKILEVGMAKNDGKNWKQGWQNFLVEIGNSMGRNWK